MITLTISRADLMSGDWQNTKEESCPSPQDVPITAAAKIVVDWMIKDGMIPLNKKSPQP